MATNNVQNELYPLSTEDNRAIPLDVIRPLAVIRSDITSGALKTVNFPADWRVAAFFSPGGCYVEFSTAIMPAVPVDGVAYSNVLFIPPSVLIVATVLPGACSVASIASTGSLTIQQVQKWSGMALRRQASSI